MTMCSLFHDNLARFLYPLNISIKQKIETICRDIYGADSVEYSEQAEHRIEVHEFVEF
jgi:formyltetrahydrofolate synthetase